MLPLSRQRRESTRVNNLEEVESVSIEEENVKTKIELFEQQKKRKADDESRGSPEASPRVRKVARKRKIKKRMNPTQEMLARLNKNIMSEFKKVRETIEDSKDKLIEIEDKTEDNSKAIKNVENKVEKQETRINNIEDNIKLTIREEIKEALKLVDEKIDEKLEQQQIMHQASPVLEQQRPQPVVPLPPGPRAQGHLSVPPGPPLPPGASPEEFPGLQNSIPNSILTAPQAQHPVERVQGPVPPLMDHLRQETRSNSWVDTASRNLPFQPPTNHVRPSRINFDSQRNHKEPKHELTVEEIEEEFGEAPKWAGLVMEQDDWMPYFFPEERNLPWSTLLTGAVYDKNRKQAVRGKIELQAKIHCGDFLIKSLYVTMNQQVIAWIESTENRIRELFKRAAQINSKSFKTKVFVPKMARQRKADIDKLLLGIKEKVPDLRYIIRNGHNDLQVLLKRGALGKYRQFPIERLGSISPLDPIQRNQIPESPTKFEEKNDGFVKVPSSKRTLYRQAVIEQVKIMDDVLAFVSGKNLEESQ